MKYGNITTEQRSHDWIAFLNNDRRLWEAGETEVIAIGKLVMSHPECVTSTTLFDDVCKLLNLSEYDVAQIENPEFEKDHGRVHNWRNHLAMSEETWDTLSNEAKAVAYYSAKQQADREEWE